jgi:hypothetical protein
MDIEKLEAMVADVERRACHEKIQRAIVLVKTSQGFVLGKLQGIKGQGLLIARNGFETIDPLKIPPDRVLQIKLVSDWDIIRAINDHVISLENVSNPHQILDEICK